MVHCKRELTHLHFFLDLFVDSGHAEKDGGPDLLQGGHQRTLQSVLVGEVDGGACKKTKVRGFDVMDTIIGYASNLLLPFLPNIASLFGSQKSKLPFPLRLYLT
jgi:hypothetical protein